jgi:hypothetical protein
MRNNYFYPKMLTPLNTSQVPRGGWSVTIEGAGPEIRGDNFSAWIREVFERLQANGLDHHNWRAETIDLMCRQRPDIPSEDHDAPQMPAKTADDVLRFLRTMWKGYEEGVKPVSDELQNRRIDTCLACPKLTHIACSIGCSSLSDTINRFVMGRNLPKFPEIQKQACSSCGCTVSVKSMWPVAILREVDEKSATHPNYPQNCWMVTEG